jgi:hypothetical protein
MGTDLGLLRVNLNVRQLYRDTFIPDIRNIEALPDYLFRS